MTPMPRPPWGPFPEVEWDDENVSHIARHRVESWEVDEILEMGDYEVRPHAKRRKEPKYRNRYLLNGTTLGGRRLVILVDRMGPTRIRPVTARDDE